jgi:hypothetical protein
MVPHTVYRFYNATDDLLYVGVTADWETRHAAHRIGTPWYPEVARHELERFATDAEARDHEATTIASLAPRYNRRPGGGGRRTSEPEQHRIRSLFTLSPTAVRQIEELAARNGQSKSAVVERAIREMAAKTP